MSENRFLWNSLDGGENVFIKERGSDKIIHIKIIEGKYEFVEFMKKVNGQQEENEQLRMKLKGENYIMVSEMLSNLRKTGICDGCKNKDKPVEWYLERGFSITERVCDRYEPEV